MKISRGFAYGVIILLGVLCARVFAATQNYISKYGSAGALVDSVVYESGGNIGIGTTAPSERLTVQGTIQATDTVESLTTFRSGTGNDLRLNANGVNRDVFMQVNGTTLMTVQGSTTNVGIGTTSPTAKLHVAGDIKVDGNIAAKYQDVAEWVHSTAALDAGTLVVIDQSSYDTVTASTTAYDTRVVGAVSVAPGVVLGERKTGRVMVAQSGRVRVKADARYGAIRQGDLLVSSPTKGAAMRSEVVDVGGIKIHRPGTLIGKALEPLSQGTGEILILLALQ